MTNGLVEKWSNQFHKSKEKLPLKNLEVERSTRLIQNIQFPWIEFQKVLHVLFLLSTDGL